MSQAQEWLRMLRFPQSCLQCGQDFTEEENHSKACHYHPGHFTFGILPLRARCGDRGDDMVLLSGWDCCHKDVTSHPDACPCNAGGQHAAEHGAVAGVVLRASTIERPVVIGLDGKRYVVGQTTTSCCHKKLLTVTGCFVDCHRGSLTLANQHEDTSPDQTEFRHRHKAAYQMQQARKPKACTRCKQLFQPGQQGGCKHHPGAQDFECRNEGTANERYIFDHYDCCQKRVHDSPGCLPNGRHASQATDTLPFPVADQVWEQACTHCCRKTLADVPGCRPADHEAELPQIMFAQEEATHIFYVERFMTSVARYVKNAQAIVPADQGSASAVSHALNDKLTANSLPRFADAGKVVKCSICWDEFAWGGVVDGSDTARQLTEQQATCCPNGFHFYCQACLQGHVQSKIQALVTTIDCPQAQACSSQAWTPKEVACFVDREMWPVYNAFGCVWEVITAHCREVFGDFDKLLLETAAKAAGNVISCPACGEYSEFQGGNDDGNGFPQQPVQLFRCIKCLQVSCLKCKASVGLDRRVQHECALTVAAARRKLEEVLTQAGMLTCPNCSTSIVKSSGCNHMTCSKCRTHLCLLCCQVLAQPDESRDVYQHFAAGRPCWVFDNAAAGQTEESALQRRQITAANKYLATLETIMALRVVQGNPLLKDFPDGSIMISACHDQ